MTDDDIRGLIRKYQTIRHCRRLEDLRKKTEIGSNTTFLKKWNNPKSFTIRELQDIFDYLKIPYEERQDILK